MAASADPKRSYQPLTRSVLAVIGAGPGSNDMVAIRGRRWLRAADVVFYEPGISAALLGEAPIAAETVPVEQPKEQIARALAHAAARKRVVWLASGAGSKTAAMLHDAAKDGGVAFEYVPGVATQVVAVATGPLQGKQVLVTRARHQMGQTCRLLEDLGATAISLPTIEIHPPEDPEPLWQAAARIDAYDRLVLTSANTVSPLDAALRRACRDARALAGVQICAIGPATARRLEQIGLRADLVAADYRAEGLLEALEAEPVDGQQILVLRAAVARELLPDTLRQRGARVDVVTAYVTSLPDPSYWRSGLLALRARAVDVITFTSASTARHFARIVGDELHRLVEGAVIAAIGPVTAEACTEVGMNVDLMPTKHTLPALIDLIVQYYGERKAP